MELFQIGMIFLALFIQIINNTTNEEIEPCHSSNRIFHIMWVNICSGKKCRPYGVLGGFQE